MNWRRAKATLLLAATMISVFAVEVARGALADREGVRLAAMGAIVPGTLEQLQFWRFLFAAFLHAGFLHLAFNLWAFVQIGYGWELLFGTPRFLVVFLVTAIVAGASSALFVKPPGAVGASGVIFGLLSSFTVLLMRVPRWRTARWTRRLAGQLAIWGVITITVGFFSPRIDNAAHLGGIVGGIMIALVMLKFERSLSR